MNTTKTLVFGRKMVLSGGSQHIELSIPAWKSETVLVPITSIPRPVLIGAGKFPDNCLRFYAEVNLEAETQEELSICNFETLNLLRVFGHAENAR